MRLVRCLMFEPLLNGQLQDALLMDSMCNVVDALCKASLYLTVILQQSSYFAYDHGSIMIDSLSKLIMMIMLIMLINDLEITNFLLLHPYLRALPWVNHVNRNDSAGGVHRQPPCG